MELESSKHRFLNIYHFLTVYFLTTVLIHTKYTTWTFHFQSALLNYKTCRNQEDKDFLTLISMSAYWRYVSCRRKFIIKSINVPAKYSMNAHLSNYLLHRFFILQQQVYVPLNCLGQCCTITFYPTNSCFIRRSGRNVFQFKLVSVSIQTQYLRKIIEPDMRFWKEKMKQLHVI